MDKKDYLFKALKTDIYKDSLWISALICQLMRTVTTDEQVYTLKYIDDKVYFLDLSKDWQEIDGSYKGKGLFSANELIDLPPDVLENAPHGVKETTVGRIILNKIALCYPFGDKVAYINENYDKLNPKYIENKIIKDRLRDTPPEGAAREKDYIYMDEYDAFCDSCMFLSRISQSCVPGITRKAISKADGIDEYKEKVINEAVKRGENLNDPVVFAKISALLTDYDKNSLRGDRSEVILIKAKDHKVVRRKLFNCFGSEKGFDNKSMDPIYKPLSDGINYTKLAEYINASRHGSFSRGAETQLGGVAYKELLRASQTIGITQDDCHSKFGVPTKITEKNAKNYIGYSIVNNGVTVKLTTNNINHFIDKVVVMRSPAFCQVSDVGDKFCSVCVGHWLAEQPTGLSAAIANVGSKFLGIFMAAMHGKENKSVEVNLDDVLR